MAPDVEELIKRINTLTLDKNRLRQKLTQLTQKDTMNILNQLSSSISCHSSEQKSADLINLKTSDLVTTTTQNNDTNNSSPNNSTSTNNSNSKTIANGQSNHIIADVECSTSCEDDILYMNQLYKSRLDEYRKNWDFLESKCTALLSELNALQKHFAILNREKQELEEQLKSKCDDYDQIKSELQTVVLNYETQLSAMSEHLSMITSQQTNLGDE